jgi:preprotein translocase subunit SecF
MLDIIKTKKFSFALSGAFFLVSLLFLLVFGLQLGIDFTGGSSMQIKFTDSRPEVQQIKQSLSSKNLGSLVVQPTKDKSMIIKTSKFLTEDEHRQVLGMLKDDFGSDKNELIEEKINTIGPAISSELKENSIYAAIGVVLAIIGYIAYAFRKVSKPVDSWKYGLTAIFALIHDVTITMGVFSLITYFYSVEINIPFVVAMLTILGYSVNDTIVVFDRIRDRLAKLGANKFEQSVTEGVNYSLVRSINTSLTTLVVLFSLFIFGGNSIHYFSLALIIGVALGTYSSIFLASPILVEWKRRFS